MSLLSTEKRFGRLETGVSHLVKIDSYEDVTNNQGGYVKVVFKKANGQTEQNNYFPSQINALIGQLRDAMKIPANKAMSDVEVLEKAKKTDFNIEIVYRAWTSPDTGEVRNIRNVVIETGNNNPEPKATSKTEEPTSKQDTTNDATPEEEKLGF